MKKRRASFPVAVVVTLSIAASALIFSGCGPTIATAVRQDGIEWAVPGGTPSTMKPVLPPAKLHLTDGAIFASDDQSFSIWRLEKNGRMTNTLTFKYSIKDEFKVFAGEGWRVKVRPARMIRGDNSEIHLGLWASAVGNDRYDYQKMQPSYEQVHVLDVIKVSQDGSVKKLGMQPGTFYSLEDTDQGLVGLTSIRVSSDKALAENIERLTKRLPQKNYEYLLHNFTSGKESFIPNESGKMLIQGSAVWRIYSKEGSLYVEKRSLADFEKKETWRYESTTNADAIWDAKTAGGSGVYVLFNGKSGRHLAVLGENGRWVLPPQKIAGISMGFVRSTVWGAFYLLGFDKGTSVYQFIDPVKGLQGGQFALKSVFPCNWSLEGSPEKPMAWKSCPAGKEDVVQWELYNLSGIQSQQGK